MTDDEIETSVDGGANFVACPGSYNHEFDTYEWSISARADGGNCGSHLGGGGFLVTSSHGRLNGIHPGIGRQGTDWTWLKVFVRKEQ